MANSRLERLGTIFTRITGLMRAGALKQEDKPIWYDIYAAFPPTYEPKYNRPAPNIEVKNIFYPEDEVRAQLHRRCGSSMATVSLSPPGPAVPVVRELAAALAEASDAEQREQLLQTAAAQMTVPQRSDLAPAPGPVQPARAHPAAPSSLAADFTASESAPEPKLGISISELLTEEEKGSRSGS